MPGPIEAQDTTGAELATPMPPWQVAEHGSFSAALGSIPTGQCVFSRKHVVAGAEFCPTAGHGHELAGAGPQL